MKHIGIIPDGYRRWARKLGGNPSFGYQKMFEKIPRLATHIFEEKKIDTFSIYLCSIIPCKKEDDVTTSLLQYSNDLLEDFYKNVAIPLNVRMNHMGNKDFIPLFLLDKITEVDKMTKKNSEHTFNYLIDYNGHDEIERAIHKRMSSGGLYGLNLHLDNSGQKYPNPDLIIRYGGLRKLSSFMTYQSIYSDIAFSDKIGADFDTEDIDFHVNEFNERMKKLVGK